VHLPAVGELRGLLPPEVRPEVGEGGGRPPRDVPGDMRERIKTEMRGTGGGRWTTRAVAKKQSKKVRRRKDRAEVSRQAE